MFFFKTSELRDSIFFSKLLQLYLCHFTCYLAYWLARSSVHGDSHWYAGVWVSVKVEMWSIKHFTFAKVERTPKL